MSLAPRALLVTLALLAPTAGCGSESDVTASSATSTSSPGSTPTVSRVPSRPPDIEGTITAVTDRTILVEAAGVATTFALGDKANLTVDATTVIDVCGPADGRQPGTFADLVVGASMQVWVDGPVAESYPVQATASVIASPPCG